MAKAFSIWLILSPTLFFHFRSPEVMGCWLLLRVTTPVESAGTGPPPQSPTGAWSQPREGQVGTVFSLYGTVLPIGKTTTRIKIICTPKGYQILVIIFWKRAFQNWAILEKISTYPILCKQALCSYRFPSVSIATVMLHSAFPVESVTCVFNVYEWLIHQIGYFLVL